MPKSGYIYALSNPSFKEDESQGKRRIKIGKTENLEGRIYQLSNTSVPEPFVCEMAIKVSDMNKTEKLIHAIFENYRVTANREFFDISLELIHAAFDLAGAGGNFLKPEEIEKLAQSNKGRIKKYENISHELAEYIASENNWERGPGKRNTYYQCFKIFGVKHTKIRSVIHDRFGKIYLGVETKSKNYASYFEDVIIKNEDMIFSELGHKLSYQDHSGSNTYMAFIEFDKSEYNKDELFSKVNSELVRIINFVNKYIGDEYRK